MSLQIQMLGTGSAFSKSYFNNNALLYTKHYTMLVDCGITAPLALHHLGKQLEDIDGILITHMHADHTGGLEEFAYRSYYQQKQKKKLDLFIPEKLADLLWEHTLKGGLDNGLEEYNLDTYFNVRLLKEHEPLEVATGLTVEIMQTEHIPNKDSYSLVINDYIFYSADLLFSRELLEYVAYERGCQYILHDCQLIEPGLVHATLNELLTLPEAIQQKIQLMHYGDDMESFIGKTGKMEFMQQHKIYTYREP